MEQVVSVESVGGIEVLEKEVEVMEKEVGDFVPDTQPVIVAQEETYVKTGLTPEELKKKIPLLYEQVQGSYLDLAQCLCEVKHGELYKQWGYSTFKDYVQKELGIYYSKANYLYRIWVHFGKQQELLDKMKALRWDKMKELLHVINNENADYWLSKAQMMSADDFKKDVKTYLKTLVPSDDAETAVKAEEKVQNTPLADELHTMSFHFVYENYLTVNTAIEKVQKENPGMTPAEVVGLICAEFLATAGDGTGIEHAIGSIKRFEVFQPIKTIVVERNSSEVIHGKETFQDLIGKTFKHIQA